MKNENTTQKAEGLGKAMVLTAPTQREIQSFDEQQFLSNLREFMRSAKQSPVRGVAMAAREWERQINFRILMSLQNRERREAARAKRLTLRVSVQKSPASPSSLRIRVGASPSPD
jgi:hypothetical protein